MDSRDTDARTPAPVEEHPFEPFLPEGARVLFLGSFPPPARRWSMPFFYPNLNNDFWRIAGLVFFGRKEHFLEPGGRRFDQGRIEDFCSGKGIALYDTAKAVRRLRGNASDAHLEIVEPTDLADLLSRIPLCRDIAVTGQKASETLCAALGCEPPAIGASTRASCAGRDVVVHRLPSTSRAYPAALEKKAAPYRALFEGLGMI